MEKQYEKNHGDAKSTSGLWRSGAFPDDRCNASSITEPEDALSANNGTGNSSAVLLSSPEAAESCHLSENNSYCESPSLLLCNF